ncbi:MAG TPA: PilZ domain-containing protein [Candidatus Acidoferrum sp.]|nr:PilZ domain-containing protein [Candidatus Acidoferrum sp.]
MSPNSRGTKWNDPRFGQRIRSLEYISVHYEGSTEEIASRLPDVSPRGMFISTSREFPAGSVLILKFRLAFTGAEVRTRGEVRYCLSGVGVGVEFVGISPQAVRKIKKEIELRKRRRAGAHRKKKK